jgi:hypothetical protein
MATLPDELAGESGSVQNLAAGHLGLHAHPQQTDSGEVTVN